ncbi:hypothetical protein CK203_094886 [Vitis vinifera]|uniref:Glucan endo-1,3-beta-D-glucosidase n=1 Tax=Vitis vinifera TaxID=29760 RepID=A0A438D0A5_VITVI|nr:hypothetical protein CK203_094886 [Vitis vinifera]
MAGEASKCLLFLLLLSVLAFYSSATLVGFSYDARRSRGASSATKTVSFLKQNKVSASQIRVFVADHKVLNSLFNTGVSVDLYLNETRVESLRDSTPSSISWLKTHLLTFLPHINIQSVIASSVSSELPGKNELPRVLSTLISTHSILSSFHLSSEVKKTRSFIIVEASVDGELSMGDQFVQAMIKRATHANAVLPCSDVPMMLTVKSPAAPSGIEVAAFTDKISKSLENNTQIIGKISGLYAEVSDMEEFNQKELKREEEQLFPSSRRELLNNFHLKTTLHDAFDPQQQPFPQTQSPFRLIIPHDDRHCPIH